ncbi:YceI family protein [Staphylococcus chromogenes]|nr:YceI family protein [Staphylococcus chromogenes]
MNDFNGNFVLDPTHSRIGFWLRHAMVTKVRGEFTEFESAISYGETNSATATIKTASINTNNADRDAHVKGEDFFDVEKFPEMTFTATDFNIDGTEGTVTGDLTIKGTTKPVTLNVELTGVAVDPYGQTRVGFEATTKINRKDFGIDFNAPLSTGGVLLSEDINIEIEGSAIRQG